MTTLIWAVDGLDIGYVRQHRYLGSLAPRKLHQNLMGANALFTYRVWPSIWAGELGGESNQPYDGYQPERAPIWDRYSATAMLVPWISHTTYSQNQDEFPEGYRESFEPQERVLSEFRSLERGIENAVDAGRRLVIAGSKYPDAAGHLEDNVNRIALNVERLMDIVEKTCHLDGVDDWMVVSDHGFKYEEYGRKPDGLDAHTRDATLASSFADYSLMSEFIEGWHDDLDRTIRNQQMTEMGYV